MHQEFLKACEDKFERGAKEHKGDWNSVDPKFEIREELCDVYNYATLLEDKELAVDLQQWASATWDRLNN